MTIGIIIFSKTNNTAAVAEKLEKVLLSKGCNAKIDRVQGLNTEPRDKGKIKFTNIPNIENYDVLIFGTPVWGFSLPAAMKEYLMQLPLLYKKKVYLYVTMQFPFAFLGGNQTIKQMIKICKSKQGEINHSFVINWASKKRESQISELIETITTELP